MRKILLYLFTFLPLSLLAGPTLDDLDIRVELMDNGNARITEVRRMAIDYEGTECYIVMGNLNGSTIRDFSVSDETGLMFTNVGEWDVDRSRSYKEGKCGIVTKSNGYELCWGLGDVGNRVYTVSYMVTDLVRAYDDADGFNFMFVAMNIKPAAEHARITFVGEDGKEIPQDVVKMWAFRYDGEVNWRDGTVVAETASYMSGDEAMIVMLRFEKDFLHPDKTESGSFDQLKDRAFEGSDYGNDDDWDFSAEDWLYIIGFLFLIILSPVLFVYHLVKTWLWRRKATENLLWFRGLPYNGSLHKSYEALNAYSYGSYENKNLISALVLRLISMGAVAIEEHMVAPSGFRKVTGAAPKRMQLLAIKELKVGANTPDRFALSKLFHMFSEAAGDDNLLQPNELKSWMTRHSSSVEAFLNNIKPIRSKSTVRKDLKNVRDVLGMKLFLEDFTLANERHATEVGLWKEYLIYAELFGIAKQVRKDMMRANSEFLKMDEVCRQLSNDSVVPMFTAATLSGISSIQRASSSSSFRSSGGGGWSSFGGGGGFSGGGSGGGVR